MDEMIAVAHAVPPLSGEGRERLERAMPSVREHDQGLDFAEAIDKRDALLGFA